MREARVHGLSMWLDLHDGAQREIYEGVYEWEETRQVVDYLRTGMTVVDVGAHIGYYTVLCAKLVGPGGRVIAFEPSEYGFARVSNSTRSVAHVEVRRLALGSHSGSLRLWINRSGTFDPSAYQYAEDMDPVDVPVDTLDAQLAGVQAIDLIKLDVEGHEMDVLAGARDTVCKTRAILCEFNERLLNMAGWTVSDLYRAVRSYGFRDALQAPPGAFETRLLIRT